MILQRILTLRSDSRVRTHTNPNTNTTRKTPSEKRRSRMFPPWTQTHTHTRCLRVLLTITWMNLEGVKCSTIALRALLQKACPCGSSTDGTTVRWAVSLLPLPRLPPGLNKIQTTFSALRVSECSETLTSERHSSFSWKSQNG